MIVMSVISKRNNAATSLAIAAECREALVSEIEAVIDDLAVISSEIIDDIEKEQRDSEFLRYCHTGKFD